MKFREFLIEGGAAIKGVSKISQVEAREYAPEILKRISNVLGVKASLVKLIGSAGKKPDDDDLSGDIDIAVECEPELAKQKLTELADGRACRAMPGINVYSFAYPIGDKLVQVDLMPVASVKFAEWSYRADPADLEQGLKGAQRNELFFAVAKHMPTEVLGEGEYQRYFYDLSRGLMTGVKSRFGKTGLVKNYSTKGKKVITDDPEKIAKLMFGVSADKLLSFESTIAALKSESFPHGQVDKILELALAGIKNKGLKVPMSLE